MRIKVLESAQQLVYQVTGVQDQFRDGLLHCFYSERDGVYSKQFDTHDFMFPHDRRVLEENLSGNLERMLNEHLGVTPLDWALTLKRVCEILDQYQVRYWLAGSAACAARGIAIKPQDIDVMTFKSETERIARAFGRHIVEPFCHVSDWVVRGFGVVYLNGRVDFAFEPESFVDSEGPVDFGPQAMNSLETIEWRGHRIQVPPASLHLLPNRRRNRADRVKLIEDYIRTAHKNSHGR